MRKPITNERITELVRYVGAKAWIYPGQSLWGDLYLLLQEVAEYRDAEEQAEKEIRRTPRVPLMGVVR